MELNKALSTYARRKELAACRAAFAVGQARKLTDAWSHAILINAHATCGDGKGAEQALSAMRVAGHRPCVMSYTAALKAPCACGDLDAARRLLREMETDFSEAAVAAPQAQPPAVGAKRGRGAAGASSDWVPNVRTANTFIRGCLVAGSASDATELLARLGVDGLWSAVSPDCSTLEYVGALCAQALRLVEASRLADRLAAEPSGAHAAARVRVGIARAALLLGKPKRCVAEVGAAGRLLLAANQESSSRGEVGGVESRDGGDGHATFREHQQAEALAETRALEELAKDGKASKAAMPLLLRRVVCLRSGSGSGAAQRPAEGSGLAAAVEGALGELVRGFGLDEWRTSLNRKADGTGDAMASALRARMGRVLGGDGKAARSAGPLNLDALFAQAETGEGAADGGRTSCRLELGCGAGEWVAAQAAAAPSARWLALEVRRDRAYATAARLALARRSNAAVVACDATGFLEEWTRAGQLDALFVNHPEPPRQAKAGEAGGGEGGDGGESGEAGERAHMLDSRMLRAAAAALHPGGTFTIVTDNQWYAERLYDTLAAHNAFVRAQYEGGGLPASAKVVREAAARKHGQGVQLVCAKPGAWCRHAAEASSYFDRLWQTGISVHSAKHERYVLHVARAGR